MPAYDYVCHDCGERFEIQMSISAYSEGTTPLCSSCVSARWMMFPSRSAGISCGSARVARSFGAVNVLTGGRSSGGSYASSCGTGGFT